MTDRKRQMCLGLSVGRLGWHPAAWRLPEVRADAEMDFDHFVDCARIAAEGRLDFLLLDDRAAVPGVDDPRSAPDREHGHLRHDTITLAAALAGVSEHVGLIPTCSTRYHQPYSLARRLASIDHISRGRLGWSLSLGSDAEEARNFGGSTPVGPEARPARAREFVAVMEALWDSWDDDAFIRDKASGLYFDRTKFHWLDHQGVHFKVRGPLDTARPPQGKLPLAMKGEAPEVLDLAAALADLLCVAPPSLEAVQRIATAVRARMRDHGRAPESLRICAGIMPFLAPTQQEAQAKFDRMQALQPHAGMDGMVMIGSPAKVADAMEECFAAQAADGFTILPPCLPHSAQDVVALLIPELQRRGLFRTAYEGTSLRHSLGLPRAISRYAQPPADASA